MKVSWLQDQLPQLAEHLESSAEELNGLDAQLGDGDLGVTMVRGSRQLLEIREELPDDWGMALLKCAQAFTKTSGSSYGTILATGLMAMAKQKKGQAEMDSSEWAGLLKVALEAMQHRGKAKLGQKTVLDPLSAAQKKLESDPETGLLDLIEVVQQTIDEFRDKPCQIGRARIFQDKSIGLDDPGMVAFKRLLEGIVPN
ncbi:MAG: dihydroxyacetone kinase subunit L [Deltaproteobacteria bacterium]|jgi:phosphoenolpyruvate---glycerone phosphotransferase subunit DhaL|nr:dihydroxyacetone kinase subunit L [Deltaproteobacteria bacterium]MBT7204496.1 dihydroxyacetone kinase subunit L [Deltaproteobacteria bacterium]